MSEPNPAAPSLWRRLLAAVVPPSDRDHVLYELDTLYAERVSRLGVRAANRWYRREVLGFVTSASVLGVGSRIRAWGRHTWEVGMGETIEDLRSALRSLRRSPGVAILAASTLAVSIAGGTLMFAVADHIMFRALPYSEPDRIVALWPEWSFVRGELDILERELETLEAVAGYVVTNGHNLELPDESQRISGAVVSPALLPLLGVEPILGRSFVREEAAPGSDAVVLLSYGLWSNQFGSEPETVGQSIVLDGRRRTVVGVLPQGFSFPGPEQDVLLPLVMNRAALGDFWGSGGYRAIGRLAAGATVEAVGADLQRLNPIMSEANPIYTPDPAFRAGARVVQLREAVVGDLGGSLFFLLGAVGLLLLIGCGNAANLLLARGLSRERYYAVRSALGADRLRLIREQLAESLVIAGLGCVVAVVGSTWLLDALVSVMPAEIPRTAEISLDVRVVLAGVTMAVFAAGAAGIIPALRGSAVDPGAVLRNGGLRVAGGKRGRALSQVTVIAQMAAAVVLTTGAVLLARSLGAITAIETGFEPEGLTVARLTLSGESYADMEERLRFFETVAGEVRAAAGIEEVAVASRVPFSPGGSLIATGIEDVTGDRNLPMFNRIQVTPGYFETMGIPVVTGRIFDASDRAGISMVAMVDQTAANRFWPGESPIGQRLRYPYAGAEWIEIVGVVGGVATNELTADRMPTYYQPIAQVTGLDAYIVVRGSGDDAAVAAAVRDAVSRVDNRVPISQLGPMRNLLRASLGRERWMTTLLTLFAAVALLMGAVGVYGVLAYSVRQRTREIGVRIALGARRGRICRDVLGKGVLIAGSGALVGLILAISGARLIVGLLYGVSPLDPLTLGAASLVSMAAALLAASVPAMRATGIDALTAIREEG